MTHTAILGTQWGDEGKGKIVDYLARSHDIAVRCQGGNNAGHTVVIDGEKYPFHLLPSAVLHPRVTCVLGNGMVINPEVLVEELNRLESKVSEHARILVSERAHIITPALIVEDQTKGKGIGTTGRGIGPTYQAKAARTGIRVSDFLKSEEFSQELRDRIKPLVADTSFFLHEQIFSYNRRILFEGAQATMLDIDHGTYPFVTSSSTTTGGIFTGSGIFVPNIKIIGVAKAYTTRVGNGPFPTELTDNQGDILREKGHEYGTTTGRPRRCGWLDLVVLRHSSRINGLNSLAITKLDILTGINPIKVCTGYFIEGKVISSQFPADLDIANKAEPIYQEFLGWDKDISQCKNFYDLPDNAKYYIRFIEHNTGLPVQYIGIGPERIQIALK